MTYNVKSWIKCIYCKTLLNESDGNAEWHLLFSLPDSYQISSVIQGYLVFFFFLKKKKKEKEKKGVEGEKQYGEGLGAFSDVFHLLHQYENLGVML